MANNPIKYSDLVRPDSSITDLIAQLERLSEKYEEALKGIKSEAVKMTESAKNVSGATEEGRKSIRKMSVETAKLEKAEKEYNFALSETHKQIEELRQAKNEANKITKLTIKLNNSAEGSYNRLSAQYSLNKIRLDKMSDSERDAAEASTQLVSRTNELYERMKKLQEETGKHQLNVGNYTEASDAIIAYGDRLKETLHLNNSFGESLLALGKGGEKGKEAFSAMSVGAKALGKTLLGLLRNPIFLSIAGVGAAGVAFKWWYDYNKGLVEATRLTQQFTGKEGEDLKAFRNEVQAIADTFHKDFQETLIASNALAKQFGIDASAALALIKDGFIAGGDANGEFLDSIKEYPAYFKEAGISAEAFVAIVAQTNKAGIFSDKGIDAIKEGNLRIREMTKATADALEGIGISSAQVQTDLQSGAKTTFDIMREVSAKLNELPAASSKVGTAIADIFGGPGEDAGLQFLKTLKDISTNMDEVKKGAGELGKLQEQQVQANIELKNAFDALFDSTGGGFERMTTNLKVIATKGITSVIKGVIKLTNYFIDLYNESGLLRVAWNTVVSSFKMGIDGIGNLVKLFIDYMKGAAKVIKGVFTLDWSEVGEGIKQTGMAWKKFIDANIRDTYKNIGDVIRKQNEKVEHIKIPVTIGDADTKVENVSTTDRNIISERTENISTKEIDKTSGKDGTQDVINAYKRMQDIIRQNEDAQLAIMEEGDKKKELETKLHYRRQIEALKLKLETEKDLTSREKVILQDTISLLEKKQEQEVSKIYKKEEVSKITEVRDTKDLKPLEFDEPEKKDKDIYESLGLDLSDEQKEGIKTSMDFAKEQLQGLLDAKLAAAQAAVEASDREVNSAQAALQFELEARNKGYANNVELARKELDMAKKNQQKALKNQKKVQREQLALQSVEQATNLVTATSKIFQQLGAWAFPVIASMWVTFAASKIKAFQLTKGGGTEKYAEGTVELLQGGSHASGHDIDMGTKPDGTRRRAEGGEFFAVINKRNSRRFRKEIPNIINSLNNGTFAHKYQSAYEGAGNISVSVAGNSNSDVKNMAEDVHEIRMQNKIRCYTDADGNMVEVYKNLKRKIVR